ncbi:protein CutA homolog [Denticeps clupeoides]|uniref:Protein CutA homolog n=1 Tax=Denticeps clupeoides TaxID=299321 RepID=A0AAY4AJJ4_9TELE|nr:protein CutA homolog [Denticeps clupeoides]XP_028829353.1 protein CutA homolog [Denticeps clupeoides]
MAFIHTGKLDWLCHRWQRDSVFQTFSRSTCVFVLGTVLLTLALYPVLRTLGVQLHSALTGSYVAGHHSIMLINCPTEQTAKDIGRALMEKRMVACVNILPRAATMYYWKGEIQEATEILLLLRTRSSKIQKLTEYIMSIHPYENPEILSFPVEDGSLDYMKWIDDAVPINTPVTT